MMSNSPQTRTTLENNPLLSLWAISFILSCIYSCYTLLTLQLSPADYSSQISTPLLLSLLSGLATSLGAILVILFPTPLQEHHLAFTSGMAASVMITVSLLDMLLPALAHTGAITCAIAFTGGAIAFFAVELLTSSTGLETALLPAGTEKPGEHTEKARWLRLGVLTAVTLTLHNLPEGLAVAISSVDSLTHGLAVAAAIALHNIPEGLAIATPFYAATKNPTATLLLTTFSGISEPLGALLALGMLRGLLTPGTVHVLLALVAGTMVTVSVRELIPQGLSRKDCRPQFYRGSALGVFLILLDLYLLRSSSD